VRLGQFGSGTRFPRGCRDHDADPIADVSGGVGEQGAITGTAKVFALRGQRGVESGSGDILCAEHRHDTRHLVNVLDGQVNQLRPGMR
jgi:hypothetical protein